MNDIHSRLRDGLPEHAQSTNEKDFATDPRSVRVWIDSLPLANISAAEAEILAALQTVDARKMSAARRFRVLETMREPVAQLADMVSKLVGVAALPLPDASAAHGQAALESQQLLAAGYRRVLVQATAASGKIRLFRKKLASAAATRAQQHGALTLRIGYMLYRAPPPGNWQALHDVCAWLSIQGLLERKVPDPELGAVVRADAVYLEALLLALANPYRFSQRERLEVATCLHALAVHAQVSGPHAPEDGPGGPSVIRIALGDDAEPGRAMRRADDEAPATWLAVDLAPLLAFVEDVIASMPPDAAMISFRRRGASTVHVQPRLVRRLLSAWVKRAERLRERHPGDYSVATAIGIHDMHYQLSDETSFGEFLGDMDQRQVTLSGDTSVRAWLGAAAPRTDRLAATVLDQSLSGYRLGWAHDKAAKEVRAKVGDPIAIGLPTDGEHIDWMIGVIRWLRSSDDMTEGGVRLLARQALPIGMRTAKQAARGQELQRGFLLLDLADPALGYTALLMPALGDDMADGDTLKVELALPADISQFRSVSKIEHIHVPVPSSRLVTAGGYDVLPIPSRPAIALAPARATA